MREDKKILIIDDEIEILELIGYILNSNGFDTKLLYSGEKVIQEIQSYKPHLVILDVILPINNGLIICQEISEIFGNIPIISLSK